MLDIFYFFIIINVFFCLVSYCYAKYQNHNTSYQPIFNNKWSNILYFLSYIKPFIWFIDEENKNPKTKEVKQHLHDANLTHVLNYRCFTVLKLVILMSSVFSFFIIMFLLKNIHTILYTLFRTEVVAITGGDLTDMNYIVICILLGITLLPNIIIKKRANDYKYSVLRDIPLIQMFIVLMLRSNKTTSELMYGLSTINTTYRETFNLAYLKYLRSPEECFSFLEITFEDTELVDTIKTLRYLPQYLRTDTITVIESQMEDTITNTTNKKRRKDVSSTVFSQATIVFPFISFILLVLAPIGMYGISLLGASTMLF